MWYIASMSFQLVGAIILLWSSVQKKIEEQIPIIYFEKESGNIVDEDEMISLNKEKVKDIAKSIILNRCAFVYLILGYATTICAEKTMSNCYTVTGVIVFSSILFCIGCCISEKISKAQAEKNVKVPAIDSRGSWLLYDFHPFQSNLKDDKIDKTERIIKL